MPIAALSDVQIVGGADGQFSIHIRSIKLGAHVLNVLTNNIASGFIDPHSFGLHHTLTDYFNVLWQQSLLHANDQVLSCCLDRHGATLHMFRIECNEINDQYNLGIETMSDVASQCSDKGYSDHNNDFNYGCMFPTGAASSIQYHGPSPAQPMQPVAHPSGRTSTDNHLPQDPAQAWASALEGCLYPWGKILTMQEDKRYGREASTLNLWRKICIGADHDPLDDWLFTAVLHDAVPLALSEPAMHHKPPSMGASVLQKMITCKRSNNMSN